MDGDGGISLASTEFPRLLARPPRGKTTPAGRPSIIHVVIRFYILIEKTYVKSSRLKKVTSASARAREGGEKKERERQRESSLQLSLSGIGGGVRGKEGRGERGRRGAAFLSSVAFTAKKALPRIVI